MAVCLKWVLQSGFGRPLDYCSTPPQVSVRCYSAQRVPVPKTTRALCVKKYKAVKVFQDDSKGIVCYRNEFGEVICEGYDEGPHFHPSTTQQQEQQYRHDSKLYSFLPEIRPYLVEGVDYECIKK
eukprot:Gb_27091 [translate_table: standard]